MKQFLIIPCLFALAITGCDNKGEQAAAQAARERAEAAKHFSDPKWIEMKPDPQLEAYRASEKAKLKAKEEKAAAEAAENGGSATAATAGSGT